MSEVSSTISVVDRFSAVMDSFKKHAAETISSNSSIGQSMKNMLGAGGPALLGVGAAFAVVAGAATAAFHAWAEEEAAAIKAAATTDTTGDTFLVVKDKVDEFSKSMAIKGPWSMEQYANAITTLVVRGHMSMDQAMQASTGYLLLTETYGMRANKAMKQLSEDMEHGGNILERYNQQAKNLSDPMTKLNELWNATKTSLAGLGGMIATVLSPLINGLTTTMQEAASWWIKKTSAAHDYGQAAEEAAKKAMAAQKEEFEQKDKAFKAEAEKVLAHGKQADNDLRAQMDRLNKLGDKAKQIYGQESSEFQKVMNEKDALREKDYRKGIKTLEDYLKVNRMTGEEEAEMWRQVGGLYAHTQAQKTEVHQKEMEARFKMSESEAQSQKAFTGEFVTTFTGALGSQLKSMDEFARVWDRWAENLKNMFIDKMMQIATNAAIGFILNLIAPGAGSLTGGGSRGLLGLGGFLGFLAGGVQNNPRSGWAVVGEKGPELMHVPQGASVVPNGGGGGTTVNLTYAPSMSTASPADARNLAIIVSRELQKLGR